MITKLYLHGLYSPVELFQGTEAGVATPPAVAAVGAAVTTFATDKMAYSSRTYVKHMDFI